MEASEFDEIAFFRRTSRTSGSFRSFARNRRNRTKNERPRLSTETAARIRSLTERHLSLEEVNAAMRVPIGPHEREGILALVSWFRRRYPTPAERLVYIRRAYRRWQGTLVRGS